MKKLVSALAAVALITPSIASAATPAQALSVKAAAVKPVRVAAKPGDAEAVSKPLLILLGLAAVVGAIVLISDGDDSR